MLVLFETAAGFTLWRVTDEGVLKCEDICAEYPTTKDVRKILELKEFEPFSKTAESVQAMKNLAEDKLDAKLTTFLQDNIINKGIQEKLQVSNKKLAAAIKENLNIEAIGSSGEGSNQIFRLIRTHFEKLIPSVSADTFRQLELGVSHELSNEILKFSPSKVDSMIVHSVGLLEELDKELNNYGMRVREWYGWHFPELKNTTSDNYLYAQIVLRCGRRDGCETAQLDDILTAPMVEEIRKNAKRSIGTELSDADLECIQQLCTQVIELTGFRNQIADYIRVRMQAIAPNLTELVGETVGSRLIAHAGSLQKLARLASSTVQVYGAEKALFRAIKEKKPTPKYGYLFHATLVTQADQKFKGQTARSLAAKVSLSSRYDSFADDPSVVIGASDRERIENQISAKKGQKVKFEVSRAKKIVAQNTPKAEKAAAQVTTVEAEPTPEYKVAADFQISEEAPKKKRRRHHRHTEAEAAEAPAE